MTPTPTFTVRRALLAGAASIVACLLAAAPASAESYGPNTSSGIPIPPAPSCAEAKERVAVVTNQLMGEQMVAKSELDKAKIELRNTQRALSKLQATVAKDQLKGRVTSEITRLQIDSITKTVGQLTANVARAQQYYDAARARSSANKAEAKKFLRQYCK